MIPAKGGLRRIRAAHDAHIEAVEGPPLPSLSRAQVEALLSYGYPGEGRARLTAGAPRTLAALERLGLVVWVSPRPPEGGGWVPTEAGHRVIRVVRRARAA